MNQKKTNTIVCSAPGSMNYQLREKPFVQKGHSILRVKRIGVCGTDLHAFEGTQPFFKYPRVLGHELSAELVETDGAAEFTLGETVTIIPYFNCEHCIACRSGKPNCCVRINVCGVHSDGAMTEYLSVPSYSLVHSEGLTDDALALVEPLAIGAHGVQRAQIKPDEFVLVVGAGPIGLGTMEFARIAGAKVIVLDVNDHRLKFCKDVLKVEHLINASSADVGEQLKSITRGDMPEVIIDATGSQRAITNSFQYMSHGGRYVLIGLQKGEVSFNHPEFHKREATLMSSRNATRRDFEHVIDSIKRKKIDPTLYITHRIGFDQLKDQFEILLDPDKGVIKAMIQFD